MSIDRRGFPKIVGSATVAGSVVTRVEATGDAVPAFGFDEDSVPMNAANLCPMPAFSWRQ